MVCKLEVDLAQAYTRIGDTDLLHNHCKICSECNELIKGQNVFLLETGKIIDAKCSAKLQLGPCSVCNKLLDDEFTEVDKKYYHKKCYSCDKCQNPLGRFYILMCRRDFLQT